MKTAVVFLTRKPEFATIDFAEECSVKLNALCDVFICSDERVPPEQGSEMFNYICIDDITCAASGYINSMFAEGVTHIKKAATALDKALFFFCHAMKDRYDFVWLFEDDCFVPSTDAIKNLIEKYSQDDLVTRDHKKKTTASLEWHWKNVDGKLPRPWFSSMSCCVGLSSKMLAAVREYLNHDKARTLLYHEIMFNTIAEHNNLEIVCAPELKTVAWEARWSLDDVLCYHNNIFHPVKDFSRHIHLRVLVQKSKEIGYTPVDKLPLFLTTSNEE